MSKVMMTGVATMIAGALFAGLEFGTPFADNAVLQRGVKLPVWGRADAGAVVEVSFAGHRRTTVADAAGRWRVEFPPLEASSAGSSMVATATPPIKQSDNPKSNNSLSPTTTTTSYNYLPSNQTILRNLVVGEVWFASGQSNMECPIVNPGKPRYRDGKGAGMVAMTQLPNIRFVKNARLAKLDSDLSEIKAEWRQFTSEELVKGEYTLSAVAFYFAREMHLALGVPIGIVDSSWGGANIDAWTPRSAYQYPPKNLIPIANYPVAIPFKGPRQGAIVGVEHQPCVLWNGMVRDYAPMAMRGVIWYQGCASAIDDRANYSSQMHAFLDGWRREFANPDLKLCFVQINPLGSWTEKFNEIAAQQERFAEEETGAWMVVGSDLANPSDVHPNDKETIAQRLAMQALRNVYGFPIEDADSPKLARAEFVGREVHLTFDHAKSFYVYAQGTRAFVPPFEVAGADGAWQKADLLHVDRDTYQISGGTVTNMTNHLDIWSPKVEKPVKARYLAIPGLVSTVFNELNLPLGYFCVEAGETGK